ncbi:hypothetical protein A5886_000540 [Enterococcus sp. 8G7_MSG3316]|uniref:Uncharacterized protein n=1 Tax=Candidatus Enterococcus testudinis TaxID=1834191 RepID=A0A242A3J9_9ENTE|nr:hypothetical protein [Enterococcus sp. 8G7_MSG3316]OTN75470.1 hypothetical protein A5886_000540 [Enterococcus sp. 8G7_MSG3316]
MKFFRSDIIQKILLLIWTVGNLVVFAWLGKWYVGLIFLIVFYLILALVLWLTRGVRLGKKTYDERQLKLKSRSYELGLTVGGLLLFLTPNYFGGNNQLVFFVVGLTSMTIFGYQIITDSLFAFNESPKERYASLSILTGFGAVGLFLYIRDTIIGTQSFFANGRIAIDSGFWLILACFVVGCLGWIRLYMDKRERL